jgi:SAM-dependent methyltransferase
MPLDSPSLYADGPLAALMRRELSMLTPILDGVFGVWGLYLRPDAAADVMLPPHLLSAVARLAPAAPGRLEGDVACDCVALPFASEAFKLVVAQHVLEQTDAAEALAEELARVLAPEGVALVFGFNPASLWRPWLARRLPGDWRFRTASGWRTVFTRCRLDVLQVRYSGMWTPWGAGTDGASAPGALGRFSGSWLLLARKRRSALAPLRLAAMRSDLKVNPTLVPGARRECA